MKLLALVLAVVLFSVRAAAQIGGPPPPPPIQSVELFAANAQSIVTGEVVGYDNEVTPPNPRAVTIAVNDVLKGPAATTVTARFNQTPAALDRMKRTGDRLLVAIGRSEGDVLAVIDLADPHLAVITADLTLLRMPNDVLDAVRRRIAETKDRAPTLAYFRRVPFSLIAGTSLADFPPSWRPYESNIREVAVMVPVDRRLERAGQAQVRSRDPSQRIEGIRALGFFKNAANIRRVRRLLHDPYFAAYPDAGGALLTERRTFPVREVAYQTLQAWRLPEGRSATLSDTVSLLDSVVEFKPARGLTNTELAWLQQARHLRSLTLADGSQVYALQAELLGRLHQLQSLTATNAHLDDYSMRPLVGLRGLRSLDLDGNPIGDASIPLIADLHNLQLVNLYNTNVSAAGLAALHTARPSLDIVGPTFGFLAETNARCDHVVYTLKAPDARSWSAHNNGRLTGPIGWSRSPSGRDYFGPFGQQSLTLHLAGLPRHGNVTVEIELFVIGSWDGNGALGAGPDVMDISIPGVGIALHSTFFNNNEGSAGSLKLQSYPDPFPGPEHLAYTGAAEVRSLGFTEPWDGRLNHRDAVYKLRYTFAHDRPDLRLIFTGETVPQDIIQTLEGDEHWGIGGLVVKTD